MRLAPHVAGLSELRGRRISSPGIRPNWAEAITMHRAPVECRRYRLPDRKVSRMNMHRNVVPRRPMLMVAFRPERDLLEVEVLALRPEL